MFSVRGRVLPNTRRKTRGHAKSRQKQHIRKLSHWLPRPVPIQHGPRDYHIVHNCVKRVTDLVKPCREEKKYVLDHNGLLKPDDVNLLDRAAHHMHELEIPTNVILTHELFLERKWPVDIHKVRNFANDVMTCWNLDQNGILVFFCENPQTLLVLPGKEHIPYLPERVIQMCHQHQDVCYKQRMRCQTDQNQNQTGQSLSEQYAMSINYHLRYAQACIQEERTK